MRQLQMMGMVAGTAAICYEHNANPGTGTGCCDTDPASFTITRHSLLQTRYWNMQDTSVLVFPASCDLI